jgi:acetate kinase
MTHDALLVVNAGSSSLKFQLYDAAGAEPARLLKGQIDGIGVRPRLRAGNADGSPLTDRDYAAAEVPDLPSAVREMRALLQSQSGYRIAAIGHRVVHGGPDYAAPVLIDADVLARLETFQSLAPLHQPNNLAPIRAVIEIAPEVPQVACFDTAFHRDHPEVADWYALPRRFHAEGVRRYGFHGLSYEYIADRLRRDFPDFARRRVIVMHLGSGASMCALKDGRSVESTMGFTALDGLPMGTRPGQLDPGVVLWMMESRGMTAREISDLLYRQSGLKGVSGVSNDMRDLLDSDDPAAAFSIDLFAYRCGLHAGALAAALEGVDAVVFTAGIGENSPEIRARIAARLGWLGARLDAEANARGDTVISKPESMPALLVVPTDEEAMIARHTRTLTRPV